MTKVRVLPADQDGIVVNGSFTLSTTVQAATRLNVRQFPSGAADLNEWKYQRYFLKSGTYKIVLIYESSTDKGKLDLGINKFGATKNTTNISNQLDTYSSPTVRNVLYSSYVTVARGLNEINFKVNGKNASSTNFSFIFNLLEFYLVTKSPVLGEDSPAQINQGSLVLLAQHKAEVAESTFTFNLADIQDFKYDEIIVEISGGATASLALQATIQGLATGYYQDGETNIAGTATQVNLDNQANLVLASTAILTGATDFRGLFTIQKNASGNWKSGYADVYGDQVGRYSTDWSANGVTAKLILIVVQTSTSTWKVGTTITVWGRKKA